MELSLERNKSKRSVDQDKYIPLNLSNESATLPISEINNIVNTYKVFDDERNLCKKYRLNVTLNPIMTNVLTNKITSIIHKNGGNPLEYENRLEKIQTIDDYTYEYRLGYDIFDNNFERLNSFKTGLTLDDFSGVDLFDLVSIEKAISSNLIDDNGWLCILNKTKVGNVKMFPSRQPYEKIDMFPTRDYFSLKPMVISGSTKQNWEIMLTYPFESYKNDILTTSDIGINGIPIIDFKIETGYNDNKYMVITTPYKHGLSKNDVIKIKRNDPNTNNTYLVYDTGDKNKENKEYIFMLDVNKYNDLLAISSMQFNRICRVVNKIDSEYYIRKFKKLPNLSEATGEINEDNINQKLNEISTDFYKEEYQASFSKNIFNDSLYQIQYIDDIDISYLKDNLGRPLTQIYFTIIKKGILDGNYNPINVFGEITSGVNSLSGNTIPEYHNVRKIYKDGPEKPLEKKIVHSGSTVNDISYENIFMGDIVEYNTGIAKETIIDDIYHRFNTIERELNQRQFIYHKVNEEGLFEITENVIPADKEGYYYKPHHLIQLKNYSAIISDGEMPIIENCFDFKSGLTYNNQLVLLKNSEDDNVKSILLQLKDLNGIRNYDYIRITNPLTNKYINVQITISNTLKNTILIPYDKIFMPKVKNIKIDNYTIRTYSSSDIPLYAQDNYDGSCVWREILSEGVFDEESIINEENVFTNGRLYLSKTFNIYLKRQDPFGEYGLKGGLFDINGVNITPSITNNKFNPVNTIC